MLTRTSALLALVAAPSLALATPALPGDYDPRISLAPLVDAVQPAVVSIEVSGVQQVQNQLPPEFRRFFGAPQGMRPFQGEGSGFVISEDGLVLTNHHVVGDASEITVIFNEGERVTAQLIGSDESLDVALLQLPQDRDWPYVAMGSSSDARVGDRVLAVGNPLGLGLTVTTGILSGKGRHSTMSAFQDFLQTDAAINPGNSGGPLFTLDGRVVGMNTAIIQGANTVGFAVPADAIQGVVQDLQTDGRVRRGYLGVGLQELTPEMRNTWSVPSDGGVVISYIQQGLPGDVAGLQAGDVVLRVDDVGMEDVRTFMQAVGTHRAGDQIGMDIWREGRQRKVTARLVERGQPVAQVSPTNQKPSANPQSAMVSLGIRTVPLPSSIAAERGLDGGLLVESVRANSAASGNLEAGDVVLQINRRAVDSVDTAEAILRRSSGAVTLLIMRGEEQRFVVLSRR
ncbi:MAG: serine protease Do [Myxococcota bacterium]|jgi:serine protease Do